MIDDAKTDISLLRRVQTADEEAWNDLVKIYAPLIYSWCKDAGIQPADAEDIVQRVLVKVNRSIGRFRRDKTFHGWLLVITRNSINDFYRSKKDAFAPSVFFERLVAAPERQLLSSTDRFCKPQALKAVVRRATKRMREMVSDVTWKAFLETAINARNSTEVAQELGITPNAVRKSKARVRHLLRKELEGLVDV